MVARVESADERAALELSKVEDDDVGVLGVVAGWRNNKSSDEHPTRFQVERATKILFQLG